MTLVQVYSTTSSCQRALGPWDSPIKASIPDLPWTARFQASTSENNTATAATHLYPSGADLQGRWSVQKAAPKCLSARLAMEKSIGPSKGSTHVQHNNLWIVLGLFRTLLARPDPELLSTVKTLGRQSYPLFSRVHGSLWRHCR